MIGPEENVLFKLDLMFCLMYAGLESLIFDEVYLFGAESLPILPVVELNLYFRPLDGIIIKSLLSYYYLSELHIFNVLYSRENMP